MKKLLTLLLVAAILLPCFLTACDFLKNYTEIRDERPDPETTTPESTTPEDNPVVDPPVVKNMTLTSVKVSAGEEDTEAYAAAELMAYLAKKGVALAEDGFSITLSIDSSLGEDAFKIEADIDAGSMTFVGGNGRGIIYAVYRFLEKYAGFRYLTPDLETQTEDPVIIPDGVLMDYAPVMSSARRLTWYYTGRDAEWCVKNGISGCDTTLDAMHGGPSLNYGSMFVHTIGPLYETTYPYPTYTSNPCLTDPANLEKAIKNVRARLESRPSTTILSVSQNDTEDHCECEQCLAIEEEEGSPAGVLLRFVNAVAENLEADYPNLIIDTLAYKYTRKAPLITKPRENVCIRLCSIECHFNHPLTTEKCSVCSAFRNDMVEWSKICDNIYVWDYTTDFSYYISFFPNLHVLRENMQFFADHNVKGMFEQGNGQGLSGEFGELRAYLLAKLMMYPYMTEEEYSAHMDEFLAAYYGAGWKNFRSYIDQVSSLAILGDGHTIYHQPFTSVNDNFYRVIEDGVTKWWDAAEELAGNHRAYVRRSRMQWRYIELLLHPDENACRQFIADANIYGIRWAESTKNNYPPDKMFPDLYP